MNRLFVAQGSLHLITALVAGETCTEGDARVPVAGDTILIHGLNPDRAQSRAWASVLEGVIASEGSPAGERARFEFIDAEAVRGLERKARWRGWRAAARCVVGRLGAHFDEIYIQGNPEWINHTIVAAYPMARVISYGDGLGLNYSESYWEAGTTSRPSPLAARARKRAVAARSALARAARAASERTTSEKFASESPPRPRFDTHCLLLANCFDDQVDDPVLIDPARTRDRIDAWIPAIAEPAEVTPIPIAEAEEVIVLVPSCFSEAGRIDREREVEAYADRLDEIDPQRRALWVVKPHPRDLAEKTARLVKVLAERNPRVTLLDDPARRYLPFEVTVRLELSGKDLPPRRFVTFSSASLALELLYGEETHCGFGEERVRRVFRPEYVERRLLHERDLARAIAMIRRGDRVGRREHDRGAGPPLAEQPTADGEAGA